MAGPCSRLARSWSRSFANHWPERINRIYDRQTAEILQRVLRRDSCCVDVGCHHGTILDEILRWAPNGNHHAFEPLPELAAGLESKYAGIPAVHVHRVALSDRRGESAFHHVRTNPAYSGLLRRRYDRPNEEVVEITVATAKLDDVLPPNAQVRLIKIDVEGAELQVLTGSRNTLRRCRPYVIFEHGLGAADCYGTRPEHVFDLLSDCGLRLSLMGRWLTSGGRRTLTRRAFVDEFDSGRNFYYLAHA